MPLTLCQKYAHLRRTTKYGLKFLTTGKQTRVLLACAPKSGSTFLAKILAQMPNFKQVSLVPSYDRREQELCKEKLVVFHSSNYVAQQHVRFSEPTKTLIDEFDLQPIVLVRNIFDTVMSLKDHFHNESTVVPTCWMNEDFKKWSLDKQEAFIVDLAVPWYFHFFVSWAKYQEKTLITYEELNQDTSGTVKKILTKLKISVSDKEINEYIVSASQKNTRKNLAVIGRGDALPQELKDRVYKFASYYSDVDFSPLGIRM